MSTAPEILSNDQKVHFRNLLERKRKNILAMEEASKKLDLDELSFEATGEVTHIKTHPADLATDTQQIEIFSSLSERNLQNLQEIEEALDRVDRGEYGVCLSCNDPISSKRLEILPEARYCIDCEQDFEDLKKNFALEQFPKTSAEIGELSKSIEALRKLMVSDIMRSTPLAVRQNEGLNQAMVLMADYNIRHLPVIDSEGDLQGIISDRDILNAVLRLRPWKLVERMENPWREVRVTAVMTKTPEVISPDTPLAEASRILLENKISCLPVVDGNRLVGVITESDFVRLIGQEV